MRKGARTAAEPLTWRIEAKFMNVSIIGTGYVGLTTGACLAFLGHKVTCVDADVAKINLLKTGRSPFYEPHIEQLIEDARANLTFTTDYAEAIQKSQVVF